MTSATRTLALGLASFALFTGCGDSGPNVDVNPAAPTPGPTPTEVSAEATPEPSTAEPPATPGTVAMDRSVEKRRSWSTPLPEGFELEKFDDEGQSRISAPSQCLFDTYQGVFIEPGFDGSDADGTDKVYSRLIEDYDDLDNVKTEPLDSVVVPAAEASSSDIEFSGVAVTYTDSGKDGRDVIYYRGMPSADATMIMWWICPKASVDEGKTEFETVLEGLTLSLRPADV